MSAHPAHDRNATALAGLRIAVGVLFLFFGEYKVFGTGFVQGGGFGTWIHRFLDDRQCYPFMEPVLRGVVLAHARPWALLVAYGELMMGIALAIGLGARLASACGFVYMLALLFSSNYPGAHAAPWMYLGAVLNHLVLALCFGAFVIGESEAALSLRSLVRR